PSRLVATASGAHRDHDETVRAGLRPALRLGIEAEHVAFADGDLFAVDHVLARATDDHVDLLLTALPLVMMDAVGVRRQFDPVDPERLQVELSADEPDHATRSSRLDLVEIDLRVAHLPPLTSEKHRRSSRESTRSAQPRSRARVPAACPAGR